MNHVAPGLVDLCLANSAPVRPGLVEKYREEDAAPILVDRERIRAMGLELEEYPVASEGGDYARHDPDRLAAAVLDVGQGQSVLLRLDSRLVLVDCGGDGQRDAGDTAADYLQTRGGDKLDVLVVSHYHSDHANGVPELLRRVEGRGVFTVVDATRDLLCNVLGYHPFLIKPNHIELGEIFGRKLNSDTEILLCARELQKRGARNVLVSMAGDGSLLLDEQGGVHRLGVPEGTVRNSVGAGDSMVAGFIAGWLERGDYGYAHKLGAAAGSATAFSDTLATEEEIHALLAQC